MPKIRLQIKELKLIRSIRSLKRERQLGIHGFALLYILWLSLLFISGLGFIIIQVGWAPGPIMIQYYTLTPPLKLMLGINQQQFANQEFMPRPWKTLGENISKLELSGNMGKSNDFAIILVPNEVTVHFNMLCPLMKHRIFSNSNGTCVVGMKRSRCSLVEAKLGEQPA